MTKKKKLLIAVCVIVVLVVAGVLVNTLTSKDKGHYAMPATETVIAREGTYQAYLDGSGQTVGLLARLQDCDVCSWWHLVMYREYVLGRPDIDHSDALLHLDLSGVEAANQRVDEVAQGLAACIPHMDTSCREMLHCWLIACEGIKVWNLTGRAVREQQYDSALAQRLERWLRQYEQLWRQVSRESELWRIRDMVRWYAARLREA